MGSAVSSSPSFSDYVENKQKQRIQEHYQKLNKSHKALVLSPKSLNYVYKSHQSSPNFSVLIPDDNLNDKSKMIRSKSVPVNQSGKKIAYLQKREHSVVFNRKQFNNVAESSLSSTNQSFSSSQQSIEPTNSLFSRVNTTNTLKTNNSTPLIETDLT